MVYYGLIWCNFCLQNHPNGSGITRSHGLVLEESGYYRLLLLAVTMHSIRNQVTTWYCCEWLLFRQSFLQNATAVKGFQEFYCKRLQFIFTTSGMPKTEDTNGRLVSKSTAHTRSGKILFMEIQVTTCYCC